MTTLTNPLGTKPFWVNVYRKSADEFWIGRAWVSREDAQQAHGPYPSYRLKVRPWIPHDGGLCPVEPHVRVRVRCRDGWIDPCEMPACSWSSSAMGNRDLWTGKNFPHEDHIIAYQIMED